MTGDSSPRGLRGGYWFDYSDPSDLSSSLSNVSAPSGEVSYVGFRLASPVVVPEPSKYAMALAGLACAGKVRGGVAGHGNLRPLAFIPLSLWRSEWTRAAELTASALNHYVHLRALSDRRCLPAGC